MSALDLKSLHAFTVFVFAVSYFFNPSAGKTDASCASILDLYELWIKTGTITMANQTTQVWQLKMECCLGSLNRRRKSWKVVLSQKTREQGTDISGETFHLSKMWHWWRAFVWPSTEGLSLEMSIHRFLVFWETTAFKFLHVMTGLTHFEVFCF